MKIRRIEATPFRIPFRRPLLIAGVVVSQRAGVLIRVYGGDGRPGVGEAAPHPLAAADAISEILRAIVQSRELLRDAAVDVPELLLRRLDTVASPVARAGVLMACYDLAARAAGVPVAHLLGGCRRERIAVNAIIDEVDPLPAAAAACAAVRDGFRCLKLKLRPHAVARDGARLAAIRAAVGPDVRIRVDANGGWTTPQAIAAIAQLAVHGLEYVEQPVPDIAGLADVRKAVNVPIAADECVNDASASDASVSDGSVTGAEAVERLAELQAADVVIVKPGFLGLPAAAAVLRTARACGLDAVITSALDTSIGVAAALHLAAAQPEPLRPAGLATTALLAGDLAQPSLVARGGWLAVPHGAGLGVELDSQALERWRQTDD